MKAKERIFPDKKDNSLLIEEGEEEIHPEEMEGIPNRTEEEEEEIPLEETEERIP